MDSFRGGLLNPILYYYNPITDREVKRRIQLAVYAYAYEFEDEILVDDHTFDALADEIDTTIDTGHRIMDKFFREEFHPDTGMWIRSHPELEGIRRLYFQFYQHRVL